jgi:leader peptidase (prepilin peptidase)/N-methyltransferase
MADFFIEWISRLGWYLGVWLFAVGAAVGSFLNVVVYRLPAGKSLVHPGSRCPACGHPIRWYHNIPVLSWLMLRGRCYDCGTKISARYPLVELTVGLMFLGLAAVELWPPILDAAAQPVFLPHATGGDIVARYAYHLWLLATLLAAALIERDGHHVPRKMLMLGIVVGLASAAAWPAVQPLFGHVLPASWNANARLAALAASFAGGLAGFLGGQVFALVGSPSAKNLAALENRTKQTGLPDPLTLACVGTFCAWQGTVLVGLVATVLWLIAEGRQKLRQKSARWGWAAFVFLAAILWIVVTRNWYDRPARWNASESPFRHILETR